MQSENHLLKKINISPYRTSRRKSNLSCNNPSPARGQGKACFTLIELLVVIAIIAILAAILLPSLQKARLRGMSAQCHSNQKQLGSTFAQYANSYDDFFPVGHGGTGYWYALRSWFPTYGIETKGTPSVKGKTREEQRQRAPLFYCPQRSRNRTASYNYHEVYYVIPSWKDHFGGNVFKFNQIHSPARKFTLVEYHYTGSGQAVSLPRYSGNAFIHAKNNNILHFDGHVEGRMAVPPFFQIQSGGNHAKFHYHWKPRCRNKTIFNNKNCSKCN